MATSIDVSVVMSVYNEENNLAETIESVLHQEGVSLELIVVDDGSTDASSQILRAYAARDTRVRTLRQTNQGLTTALIKGCAAARGRYIARQDAGDLSVQGRLMAQRSVMDQDEEIAFVSCWTEFCGPQGEPLYVVRGTGAASSPRQILSSAERSGVVDGPSCHPSTMFRRQSYERAGGYRSEFYFGQDWDLWYRLAETGTFQVIEHVLYKARVLPSCISMLNKRHQEMISHLSLEALRARAAALPERDILERASQLRPGRLPKGTRRSESKGLYFIGECLRQNSDARSATYFKRAICRSPFFIKPWFRLIQHYLAPTARLCGDEHP
jgi:glycosyltransferase involved in cell wall biosynthesis